MLAHHITVSESSLLRSPKASEGAGGALGEAEALKRGNTVGVRDQIMDLVRSQGLPVSRVLPTPTVSDQYTDGLASSQQSDGSLHSVTLAQIFHRQDLLPTPQVMDTLPARSPEKLAESKLRSPAGYANLRESVVNDLLPTVTTSEANGAGVHGDGGQDLRTTIDLLPTVTVQDGKNTGGASQFERNTKPLNTQVLVGQEWGKFASAIARWEQVLGRPAPAPTKPDGKEGAHRLSSSFTEWMMGIPENWVCGAGLSRNEELKMCGNGVVPAQASLAIRILLDRIQND